MKNEFIQILHSMSNTMIIINYLETRINACIQTVKKREQNQLRYKVIESTKFKIPKSTKSSTVIFHQEINPLTQLHTRDELNQKKHK